MYREMEGNCVYWEVGGSRLIGWSCGRECLCKFFLCDTNFVPFPFIG